MIIVTLQFVTEDEELLGKLLDKYFDGGRFMADFESFVVMQTADRPPPSHMVGYDVEGYDDSSTE